MLSWCVRLLFAIMLVSGCDRVFGIEFEPLLDAPVDVPPPIVQQFGPPTPLPGAVNSGSEEDDPSLTADLLELYLLRGGDLYVSKRSSIDELWPMPAPIMEINTAATEMRPAISRDGLTLYFTRGAVDGRRDIYYSTRSSRTQPWSEALVVPLDLNRAGSNELPGWSSADGLSLIVETHVAGSADHDLYLATRRSTSEAFASIPLEGINGITHEGGAWVTDDGQRLLFETNRDGDSMNVWEAARWGESWFLVHHAALDSMMVLDNDGTPWISPDGTTLVFASNRTGTDDLYIATRATP